MNYGQVLNVDAGGYFPVNDLHEDVALFMMDGMVLLGTDAVGVGERDLRYGLSFLVENAKAKKVPTVCANLDYALAFSTVRTKGALPPLHRM